MQPEEMVLKDTQTVCPECLIPLAGQVIERNDQVFLERTCPDHGFQSAIISTSRSDYYLRSEVPHPPPDESSSCCGPSPVHRTCLALLEITDACNLTCDACYANSPAGTHHSMESLLDRLDRFIEARGPLDILQISGGEPTIHPSFFDILDACKERDIRHLMVNTNGIKLARDQDFAAQLAQRKPNLEIYLQLDGLSPATHQSLRGADLVAIKQKAIEAVIQADLPTTLVCTVVSDINTSELGELLQLGLRIPQLRGITYQPATYTGRYELEKSLQKRATVSDILSELEVQTQGQFAQTDFRPLPCSDPNCCSFTFAHRPPHQKAIPIPRLMNVDEQLNELADRIHFIPEDAGGRCGGAPEKDDLFRVVVKPFMDRYTYDQDRINECCVHIIDSEGIGRSFCEYNVLHRSTDLVQIGRRDH